MSLLLILLALVPSHHKPPRAAQILQPAHQTWICPETPDGRAVVSRKVCFILGEPGA